MSDKIKESIDDLLKKINKDDKDNKKIMKSATKDIVDVTDKEELAKEMLRLTNEDRSMADKIFKLFYPELMNGRDRSQASKEALTRALELRINAGRNIIDLMKFMKQDEKINNSIGLFFNEKKAGINLQSISGEFEDENE